MLFLFALLSGCENNPDNNTIRFGITGTSPPHSYMENGEFKGFSVEISEAIAKELNKKPMFFSFKWCDMIAALNNNKIDAIPNINYSDERKKSIDFSRQYHIDNIVILFKNDNIVQNFNLNGKKVGCLFGSSSEAFMRNNFNTIKVITIDSSALLVESLKTNHLDAAFIEEYMALMFIKNNPSFSYEIIREYKEGDSIALRKNSNLLTDINKALDNLEKKGVIKELEKKWFGVLRG